LAPDSEEDDTRRVAAYRQVLKGIAHTLGSAVRRLQAEHAGRCRFRNFLATKGSRAGDLCLRARDRWRALLSAPWASRSRRWSIRRGGVGR